ncbi:PAS domain-containing sensor histidine kinase [Candidatus Odyssella acanthamoebae]|uniref:sensor histidine kinase n=1 Tax=Candidatus Odyssella acanthamoebae TaxID=91604 RepID=UPI0018DC8D50|nr:PAS domain-containing sensor histidine kinase [Candidatus Paracaedibacter acanthamoebae]
MAIVTVPMLRYISRLKHKVYLLQDRHYLYKILIDGAVESRCWWPKEGGALDYSYSLISLMGLDPQQPVFLQDIINQFTADDAYKLDQHIQKLKDFNDPFELSLTVIDTRTLLKVVGYSFNENGRYHFILAFSDVTDEDFLLDKLHSQVSELYKERNFYADILNSIPIALWGRDTKASLIYCNQVFAGILDSNPEAVIAEGRELIDKNRSFNPHALAHRALSTGVVQSRRSHIVVDGHRRMIETAEIPMADKSGTIGYAMDFTEHEEAHITLAKHVAAHQDILHNLSSPIIVFGADQRLEFFNKAYEKLFEFDEKYLYSKPTFNELMQDLRERRKLPEVSDFTAYRNAQLSLFNTLITPVQELTHLPDGQILRMVIAPHPLGGLLFLFDDVTDKLAMERRYNTLIAVQKETLDHLYEGIIVLGSDNRLRLSNPAVSQIWQVDDIELAPGRHAGDILYEIRHRFMGYSHWDQFRQKTLEMFHVRQPASERLILADQSVINVSYVPLPDGSHMLGFIDVSDRWRFEEALRERNEALEQTDRFKSDFISHVSYELRAPLNTIIGFTEILLNQYFGNLNERQINYCDGINESSQRLLSLINDIIDFASVEAGQLTLKIQPIDLTAFLESLIALVYNRSNDHGLEIICENTTIVERFLADERRLKQALFNLLMNAIKFTPSGGLIKLTAGIETDEDGDYLVLSVSDNGVGMSEEEKKNVFELFDTAQGNRTRFKGAGIGLPLVKSFITLHGGNIHIESAQGQGTTVWCRIPLLQEPQVAELNLVAKDHALSSAAASF